MKQWVYGEACKVLHHHPNFTVNSSIMGRKLLLAAYKGLETGMEVNVEALLMVVGVNVYPSNATGNVSGNYSNPGIPDEDPLSTSPRSRQGRGGMKCRRAVRADEETALRQRQGVQCLGVMGEGIERNIISMEDTNAMLVLLIAMVDEESENKTIKALYPLTKRQKLIEDRLYESNSPSSGTISAPTSCQSDPVVVPAAPVDVYLTALNRPTNQRRALSNSSNCNLEQTAGCKVKRNQSFFKKFYSPA